MTYEELKIKLDLYDPEDVLYSVGSNIEICKINNNSESRCFVVCDEGDCHLFKSNGEEDDIHKVTVIDHFMISNDKIKTVIIPDSVTAIEMDSFSFVHELTDVTIPDSVTYISDFSFSYCDKLKRITIGNGIKTIGKHAFYDGCDNLTDVIFKGKTMDEVKSMKNYPFGIKDKSIIKCC